MIYTGILLIETYGLIEDQAWSDFGFSEKTLIHCGEWVRWRHKWKQVQRTQLSVSLSFTLGMEMSCLALLLGIFIYVLKVGPYPNLYIFPLHRPPPLQADFLCVRAPAPTSSTTHLWFQNSNSSHWRNPHATSAVPCLFSASSIHVGICMSYLFS